MPLIPFDSHNLLPWFDETPPTSLAATHALFVTYLMRKTTLQSLMSRKRQMTSEKVVKTSRNGGSSLNALPPRYLLKNKTQFISVAYIPSRHMTLIQRRLNVDATSMDPRWFLRVFNLKKKIPYLLYLFGQTNLRKQCRLRSDAAWRGVWSGFPCLPFIQQHYTHSQAVIWTCWREVYCKEQRC